MLSSVRLMTSLPTSRLSATPGARSMAPPQPGGTPSPVSLSAAAAAPACVVRRAVCAHRSRRAGAQQRPGCGVPRRSPMTGSVRHIPEAHPCHPTVVRQTHGPPCSSHAGASAAALRSVQRPRPTSQPGQTSPGCGTARPPRSVTRPTAAARLPNPRRFGSRRSPPCPATAPPRRGMAATGRSPAGVRRPVGPHRPGGRRRPRRPRSTTSTTWSMPPAASAATNSGSSPAGTTTSKTAPPAS